MQAAQVMVCEQRSLAQPRPSPSCVCGSELTGSLNLSGECTSNCFCQHAKHEARRGYGTAGLCVCVIVHAVLRHAFDNGTAEESITLGGSDHLDLMKDSDFRRVPDAQGMYVRVPDALFERLEQVWNDQVLSEDL